MWSLLIGNVRRRTETIHNFIRLMELRDEVLSDSSDPAHDRVSTTIEGAISLADDRTFRHCAVISNLYAVYENFVEESLRLWAARLPRYRRFSELSSSVQRSYREGLAALLNAIERQEYKNVELPSVLRSYADSLEDVPDWKMVSDALLFHDANLRRNQVVKLFRYADLSNIWEILESDANIAQCLQSIGDGLSLEATLAEFVQFRNEAAHGEPDEILGIDRLSNWVAFIETLCEGLMKPLVAKNLEEEVRIGGCQAAGEVYRVLSNRIVLADCSNCEIYVGQTLYAKKDFAAYPVSIESIQINDQSVSKAVADEDGLKVGIKASQPLRRGAELYLKSAIE